nr:MAG TPA: NinB protein [Caudoviricetes sp.]
MELKGRLKGAYKNVLDASVDITFTVPDRNGLLDDFQKYTGKLLNLNCKVYKQKRSLDANAYLWVLLTKMAEELNKEQKRNKYTKDDLYEYEIMRYGQCTAVGLVEEAVEKFKREWRITKEVDRRTREDGKVLVTLLCYIGSSSYDTEEMAKLIDGVVDDCHDLGVETLPPDEIDRLKALWGIEGDVKCDKKKAV